MRVFATAIAVSLLFCACHKTTAPTPPPPKSVHEVQADDQYAQELNEIKKNIKGEVRIKLKRDGKGESYSWEITGKDPREILKANDVLAKKLGN